MRGNGDYKKTEMKRTVSQAFDSDKTNLVWQTEIERPLFLNLRYYLGLVVLFYSISIIIGYLMPNPVCTFILDIYDL